MRGDTGAWETRPTSLSLLDGFAFSTPSAPLALCPAPGQELADRAGRSAVLGGGHGRPLEEVPWARGLEEPREDVRTERPMERRARPSGREVPGQAAGLWVVGCVTFQTRARVSVSCLASLLGLWTNASRVVREPCAAGVGRGGVRSYSERGPVIFHPSPCGQFNAKALQGSGDCRKARNRS